ncbi:MAG: hypothetical protein M1835_003503, partial [Candelina submexicana]
GGSLDRHISSVSRVTKITQGTGVPGTRAAPVQAGNNDKKIGGRIDYGEKVVKDGKEYQRLKYQVKKGAEVPTLKALANLDSH